MELIPFLIFAFIAFKIFSGFTKAASKTGGSALVRKSKRPKSFNMRALILTATAKKARPSAGERAFKAKGSPLGGVMARLLRVLGWRQIMRKRQRRREKHPIKALSNMAAAAEM